MEKSKSILIAEDTPIQGKKLKYYLESFGFNVVWVKNSVEGIKEITSRKATFVMIISDIQMTGGDGFDLLEFVRKDPFYMQVPFILMTTLKEPEVKLQAYKLKVSDFIQKPFEPLELELRVKNLLSMSQFQKDLLDQNYKLNQNLLKKSKILQEKLDDIEKMYEDLKTAQDRLLNAEKHTALAVVGGGIAHEFNTPLSVITMCSSQLEMFLEQKNLDDPMLTKLNQKISNATGKISELVTHIRNYAHPTDILREKTDLKLLPMIEEAKAELSHKLGEQDLEIKVEADIMVSANHNGFVKILTSILENSIYANEKQGAKHLLVEAKRADTKLILEIQDEGGGVPEDQIFNITVPFFTLNDVGEGKGLGLALANNFCKAMNIELVLRNSGKGLLAQLIWELGNE